VDSISGGLAGQKIQDKLAVPKVEIIVNEIFAILHSQGYPLNNTELFGMLLMPKLSCEGGAIALLEGKKTRAGIFPCPCF
jgi:hypothetical protein